MGDTIPATALEDALATWCSPSRPGRTLHTGKGRPGTNQSPPSVSQIGSWPMIPPITRASAVSSRRHGMLSPCERSSARTRPSPVSCGGGPCGWRRGPRPPQPRSASSRRSRTAQEGWPTRLGTGATGPSALTDDSDVHDGHASSSPRRDLLWCSWRRRPPQRRRPSSSMRPGPQADRVGHLQPAGDVDPDEPAPAAVGGVHVDRQVGAGQVVGRPGCRWWPSSDRAWVIRRPGTPRPVPTIGPLRVRLRSARRGGRPGPAPAWAPARGCRRPRRVPPPPAPPPPPDGRAGPGS